jgi:hypothetical protein
MNTGNQNQSPIQEFLTPEAMLTPGVAGSLTMMITNALATNFTMPRAWVGLCLSFLFGLLVLVSARHIVTKCVFYVLNSLVIFCVAVGANGIGVAGSQQASFSVVTSALAQEIKPAEANKKTLEYCSNLSATVERAQKAGESPDKILELIRPCQTVSKEILTGQSLGGPNSEVNRANTFFAPWRLRF